MNVENQTRIKFVYLFLIFTTLTHNISFFYKTYSKIQVYETHPTMLQDLRRYTCFEQRIVRIPENYRARNPIQNTKNDMFHLSKDTKIAQYMNHFK